MAFLVYFVLFALQFIDGGNSFDTVNGTEFARMPPIYHYDPYYPCVKQTKAVYCASRVELFVDEPTELYTFIQEYSANTRKNFNHSRLFHGYCLTDTCKHHYSAEKDPRHVFEACMNESIYRDYDLQVRILDDFQCYSGDDEMDIDGGDIAVAVILLAILAMNILGSLYWAFWKPEKIEQGNQYLLCFSVQRNWRRLVSPTANEALDDLKSFNGMKVLTTMLVLMVHGIISFVMSPENPQFYEDLYYESAYHFLSNGTMVVQTFFVISGFLLMMHLEEQADKPFTWRQLTSGVVLRWLRLTPVYAVTLAFTATWSRFLGAGPLWEPMVMREASNCRQYWWANLLYFNNYVDADICMPHTWYLSADFHLHVLLLVVAVLAPRHHRGKVLGGMFLLGVLTPALTTYLLDLDHTLIPSPEATRLLFAEDPTFLHVYVRSHTNLACFSMGAALAPLVLRWRTAGFDANVIFRSRYVFWSFAPLLVGLILSGGLFFREEPLPLLQRALFAAAARPVFGCLICALIVGCIFKYEDVYRGVLESGVWSVLARVAYSAYIIHTLLIRNLTGTKTTLIHVSYRHMAETALAATTFTFLLAVPVWLFFEAPFGTLVRHTMLPAPKPTPATTETLVKEKTVEKPTKETTITKETPTTKDKPEEKLRPTG